ncbi:MAG: (2Fe-2S)-binding protein [Elusimicrobia bacterium]|nr:(2Fe-2S)-binding protein [Elusimicrobiota bacterium]
MPEITLSIDGVSVTVSEGALVIDAARSAGIDIPHYCYHPALGNPGVCRLCMVEVEGLPKLQVSCRLKAKEGMVVRTNSSAARRAQSSSLEFHLVNHPLDCPVCDQAGECLLQDTYQRCGLYSSTVREDKRHKPKRVKIGERIVFDSERCILCTRCVRFLDEVTKTRELGVFGRGDREEVELCPGRRVDNPYSGNIVDICPVGALTDADFRFQVRVWYLAGTASVCPGCARGCSIFVHSNVQRPWHAGGRRVVRLKPRFNPEVNGYWICDEGRYGCKSIDSPSRLKAPSLLKDGKVGAISWEDATKLVSAELAELCRAKGPQGLAVILSGTLSNEDLFAAKRLFIERLKAGHVLLRPGPDQLGEEDGLLRRKEKVPNLRGAQALGFGTAIRESSWEKILAGLTSGEIWGLYVVDRDPLAVWGAEAGEALLGLPFTLHQAANANRFTRAARWVLPSTSYAEEDATFTNFQGRTQRARKAVAPLGEARPDWRIFGGLLAALGAEFPYGSARSVFEALAGERSDLVGLDFELAPDGEPR